MSFSAKYFGSNGWLIQFGSLRVLIDPWLTGKLVFPPGRWLIEGRLNKEIKIPKNIDLVLLTQGLSDHCHEPTLKKLPKSTPVIASPSAARITKKIGFKYVKELIPGENIFQDALRIEATAGASVPNLENGYILSHPKGSVYIEPHGYLDPKVTSRKIDAVITPLVNLELPVIGSFIKGKDIIPKLMNTFKPINILASTTGGEASFSGILENLIRVNGSTEEALKLIEGKANLIDTVAGKEYKLETHIIK